jgi:hypothetical protein
MLIEAKVIDGQVVIMYRGTHSTGAMPPAEAFEIARHICDAAYIAQGASKQDPDERYEQQQAREKRKATWFEELYCAIGDVSSDFHHEAVRRSKGEEPGQWTKSYLDRQTAFDQTGAQVLQQIKDWDY